MSWKWLAKDVVLAIHDRQIAEHGGAPGISDSGLVEAALARPQNLAAYGKPDVADLAAAYAFGIAKNHGFADGNKRTAWVCARLFLRLNDATLKYVPAEAVDIMENVASGASDELTLANWFRSNLAAQ